MRLKAALYSLLVGLLVLGNFSCGQRADSNGKATAPTQPAAAPPAVAPKVIPGKTIVGSGKSLKSVAIFHDEAGPGNFAEFYMVINVAARGVDGTAACAIWCKRPSEEVYLLNDAGNNWFGPRKIGSTDVLSNSQCSINVHDMAIAEAGGNLEWTVPVTFTPHFHGLKSVFAKGINKQKSESNFALLGTWTASGQ